MDFALAHITLETMKYSVERIADRLLSSIADRKRRKQAAEQRLVALFFAHSTHGYFVEVGANDPKLGSQTWHLEQNGWQGILIEPIQTLCEQLRSQRRRSIVVQAACGAPEQRGRGELHIYQGLSRSTLAPNAVSNNVCFTRTGVVDITTLDDILGSHHLPRIDFVSIDVEGLQLEVLRGFDLRKYRPQLLLVEDHLHNFRTHRYLVRQDYRLVKRTARNNWYVPRGAAFALTDPWERCLLWQKLWLRTPLRKLRRAWKRASSRRR